MPVYATTTTTSTTTTSTATYATVWTSHEEDPIDDCRTLSQLRAWRKRQSARIMERFRTSVHPWMSDYAHVMDSVELSARSVTIDPEEEWRKDHKHYARKGWFPACVTSYSRSERYAMTRFLMGLGPTFVGRAERSEDKYAIVHLVNDPEVVIFFKELRDRARFLEWARRFERPVLFATKKESLPEEAKRLLRGRNHYVLKGSNATVISCEIIPDALMRAIQSHL